MPMPPKPRKSIILCATQRCGSTMICEDMRNAGTLGAPEEHFLPWNPSLPNKDWRQDLKGVYTRGSSENGVFAVKIMSNQLAPLDACLASIDELSTQETRLFPHLVKLFKGATWVWLRRNDILRQAISREMALQTGVNHATAKASEELFAGNTMQGYKTDYNNEARFNEHAIAAKVTGITEENLLWMRFFSDWGIEPLTLTYEENCKDFPGYLHRLAEAAGECVPADLPARKMVRLSNALNDDWFNAYTDRIARSAMETVGR